MAISSNFFVLGELVKVKVNDDPHIMTFSGLVLFLNFVSALPSPRSRASDHTENGDSRLHASSHPGDAGEL